MKSLTEFLLVSVSECLAVLMISEIQQQKKISTKIIQDKTKLLLFEVYGKVCLIRAQQKRGCRDRMLCANNTVITVI